MPRVPAPPKPAATKKRLTIKYVDGHTDTYEEKPIHGYLASKVSGVDPNNEVDMMYHMMWIGVGQPGGEKGFVSWLESVDDFDVETQPVNPPNGAKRSR